MESPAINPLGILHAGVVVSDLDRSLEFYKDMFGVEPQIRLDGLGGPELSAMYELPEVEFSIAILGFPTGGVELIEFQTPADGSTTQPRADALGSAHFAIHVADVDAAFEALSTRGMKMVGQPIHIDDGPAAGLRLAYGLDPDGNRIEIQQIPG
jgi:catechol 2,3-dioxygenase-like lactoylglutathione lyase family enzyme